MNFSSKVKQELAGSAWFDKNKQLLQDKQKIKEKEIRQMLKEALTYYFVDAISFMMFFEIIYLISESPEVETIPHLDTTTKKMLSLRTSDPQNNQELILDILHDLVSL